MNGSICMVCGAGLGRHAFVEAMKAYCSKACTCKGLGHRGSRGEPCRSCRGPVVPETSKRVDEVLRSQRKVLKAMKRRKSKRLVRT